ncbi:MAG TPA: hypothetical protein PLB46_03685 [Chitinophagales bacterium]|nr:hypothetical protein [Chitinophagales bacterium]
MKKYFSVLIVLIATNCIISAQSYCVSGNCANGFGKQVMEVGDTYEGDWVEGSRSGKGVYTWVDGSTYVGDFKNDVFHGVGKYTGATGIIIEGYYSNGLYVAPFEQIDYELAEMQQQADSLLEFINNIPEPDYLDEYYDDSYYEEEGYYDEDLSSFDSDSLMAEIYLMIQKDYDVLYAIINDYPTAFNNTKGVEDFSNMFAQQFISTTGFEVAQSNFLNLPMGYKYWQWISVINESADFLVAEANYNYYNSIVEGVSADCCTLVASTKEVKDNYNESYTTTYTPSIIADGYSSEYANMQIIVSMYKNYNNLSDYTITVSIRDARN